MATTASFSSSYSIRFAYDIQQIASAMHSDTNLVALKTDALIAQGYCLHHQEYENRFLKYENGGCNLCRHTIVLSYVTNSKSACALNLSAGACLIIKND